MKLAQRYILKRILLIFPFAIGVPFLIVWLIQLLRASGFLHSDAVPFWLLLEASAWGIPSFVVAILPFCAALSVTYAYHYMAVNSELVILRSSGVRPWGLVTPALAFGLAITLFGYFLSAYLVPSSAYKFRTLKYQILNTDSLATLVPGKFLPLQQSVVIYAEGDKKTENGIVYTGLFIHQPSKEESVIVSASEGRIFKTDEGFKVTAKDGWRQETDMKTRKSNTLRFGNYDFNFNAATKPRQVISGKKLKELTLRQLVGGQGVKGRGFKKDGSYYSELAKRFVAPLYNLGLVILAAALGVAAAFSRGHGYRDLLIISVLALVVQLFNFGTINMLGTTLWSIPLIGLGLIALFSAPFVVIWQKAEQIQKGK